MKLPKIRIAVGAAVLAAACLGGCSAPPRTAPLLPWNAGPDAMKRAESRHYAPDVDMSTPSTVYWEWVEKSRATTRSMP